MFGVTVVCASDCVDTKPGHQSRRAATSEVGRRAERLAPTQNKQSCHVPTIELATKEVSLEVRRDAALIKTRQAEFRRSLKTFPLC